MATHELHELIAVEPDRREKANIALSQIKATFDKEKLFKGVTKRTTMLSETAVAPTDEINLVATTVEKELDYVTKNVSPYLDLLVSKALTNNKAMADIVIDGQVLAQNVPAYALLDLEKQLNRLVEVVSAIKVRDSSIDWVPDMDQGHGIFKTSAPIRRETTETKENYQVIVPPTDRHPADVRQVKEVKVVGYSDTTNFTSMISTVEKAEMLDRLREITIAVKKARQVANRAEQENIHGIGESLLEYVFNGKIKPVKG